MDAGEGMLSRSGDGRVLLRYADAGVQRAVMLERIKSGIVETVFDSDGSVLDRVLLKGEGGAGDDLGGHLERVAARASLKKLSGAEYSEIRLDRKCPSCSSESLSLVSGTDEGPGMPPIMPLYTCGSCKGRSYYLTDAYLERLVSRNSALFAPKELAELGADKAAFLNELKEYIIRIYASQRIMRIK